LNLWRLPVIHGVLHLLQPLTVSPLSIMVNPPLHMVSLPRMANLLHMVNRMHHWVLWSLYSLLPHLHFL
jgi:hypothetical protein